MLRLLINGRPCLAREGATILEALHAAGVRVPTLCHDARLAPHGGCRLCVVQVAGWERPVAACTTPIAEGMAIETHTPEIEALRRSLLALIARTYPDAAYRRDPELQLHRYIADTASSASCMVAPIRCSSTIRTPTSTSTCRECVNCYRCVRICDEVQGQCVWHLWHRGDRTDVRPDGPNLLESRCVSCGACVDTCPSGALEDHSRVELGIPTDWTRTTCPYCGTGCELSVGTLGGRIVAVRPVDEAPVSKGHLCVKGRYATGFVSATDRVTEPMIRRDGTWQTTSWDEAIRFVADGFRRLRDRHGPPSVGVLGSARATNEDNYLDPEVRASRARHQQRRLLRTRVPRAERCGPEGDPRRGGRHQQLRRSSSGRGRSSSAGPMRPRTIRLSGPASSAPPAPALT